jgi:hypothetical protein
MPHWQLDRFVVKADANADYTLTELDGVTVKTLYTGPDAQTPTVSNTIHTDANGTAYAYFYGDAQLRRGGALVRDRVRQGWEFLDPADPDYGGASVRAIQLLTPAEVAEVLDPAANPTIDLAPKLQAWLDAAMGLYGDGLSGSGGRGARMLLDAGNWLVSHLDLRPGVQLIGLSSRFEVQVIQTSDYNADHFITILGHLSNSDVVQRRTEVYIADITFTANGLLDAEGEVLDCMHSEPEVFDDDVDPDDEVTRTGIIGYRFACEFASGRGYYSKKRGKNWLHECQFTRNGTAGKDSDSGGLFVQGPDALFNKVYCGSNYGHQLHIKSSETPDVSPVELGTTRSDPTLYVSLYLELCTSGHISGGNSTGPIWIDGGESDTAANEYGVHTWVTVEGVLFSFKDKTFTEFHGDVKTLPGYVWLKNIKGVEILDCTYHPSYTDDDGADPMTHTVSHRPTSIIYVQGARSTATFRAALPPPDDEMWPAGTPEDAPGGAPADPYGTITNKPDQVSVYLIDPTIDTHAHRFDRLGGVSGDKLEFVGQTEQAGSVVVPKTSMTTEIDVTKARNYVSLSNDATWTFSNATPDDGTICGVEVKASGGARTVTLPASIADINSGATVGSFVVAQNNRHFVTFLYLNNNWLIGGYPFDEWAALAQSTSYADDTAAAVGGVALYARYRTGSTVKVRVT